MKQEFVVIKSEDIELLKEVIKFFGSTDAQMRAIEEMSELTKEISRLTRESDERNIIKKHLDMLDEISDVYITITKLALLYFPIEMLESSIKLKIEKLRRIYAKDSNRSIQ